LVVGVYTHPKLSLHGLKTKSYSLLLRLNQVSKLVKSCQWT